MNIRPIEVTDAEAFVALLKNIDDSGFMLFDPGERATTMEQQVKSIERIQADNRSTFIVAEMNNRLVGFIAALGNDLNRNKHRAYIVLGVEEAYQGQGIATRMFEALFSWAKQTRITRLELTVIKDNIKALQLYKKLGFIVEGERIQSLMINGIPTNEYYLYKLLENN